MQPTDATAFRNTLTGMFRLYGQDPDALVLDAYWLALADWSLEEFQSGARHLMQTAKFMPRPADFAELRKAGRPTAGEAWAVALDAARGSNYPTDNLAVERAVRAIGGWRVIAMSTDEGLPFLERRFAEHFETMQDAEDVRHAVPQIALSGARLNGPAAVRALLERFSPEPEDA